MPWVPSVRVIVDGEPVDAATTNGPISDLTNRTSYLKSQLDTIAAGTQLLLRSQTVESGLVNGTPVYLDVTDNVFKAAQAEIDDSNLNLAGPRAFWQGIIQSVSGTTADIVIGGIMSLPLVTWAAVFDTGIFAAGPVYLSTLPGLISSQPSTTSIYLGEMRSSGEMLVRLANPGSFIDHVHMQVSLLGDPAGTVIDPAPGAPQLVNVPDPLMPGWLPADPIYFPGYVVGVQIPVGAQFGYNIQHPSEVDLRKVFPVLPPENAQFSQGGELLGTDVIQINNYGIWCMDNSYGNAPWPVDYAVTGIAEIISLWTTRFIASASVVDIVANAVISLFQAGAASAFAATSILSTDPSSLGVAGTDGDGTNGWRGDISLSNLGVTALRTGRGLTASAPSGDNVTGWKGLTDIQVTMSLPATHQWTEITGIGDQMALLTTNGVGAGASIGAMGHRLGPDVTDFIDFMIPIGTDLVAGSDYMVTIDINACVDTPAGAPAFGDVDVEFYRLISGQPISTTAYIRTEQASFMEGAPGDYQRATLGPYADVVVRNTDQLLVRIINNGGGSPLTVDTLRVMNIIYRLTKV